VARGLVRSLVASASLLVLLLPLPLVGRAAHAQAVLLGCTFRLDGPFGTAEKPVEVPSMFDHRVVGVPDPDDDSLVW
jgi:hypothetical protein